MFRGAFAALFLAFLAAWPLAAEPATPVGDYGDLSKLEIRGATAFTPEAIRDGADGQSRRPARRRIRSPTSCPSPTNCAATLRRATATVVSPLRWYASTSVAKAATSY